MKKYGRLDKIEQLELNDMSNELVAIDSLVQKLIEERTKYEKRKNNWYAKIRDKYDIPDDFDVFIEGSKVMGKKSE